MTGSSLSDVEVITANLPAVTNASRLLADGQRSNDAALRARRTLEHALGFRASQTSAGVWLKAATAFEDAGYDAHAETLRAVAATGPELDEARRAWSARRVARLESAAERVVSRWLDDGLLLVAEPYREGADGCFYGLSRVKDTVVPGEWAVVVMTSARRPQVVAGFDGQHRARAWLDDRTRSEPRPLAAVHLPPEGRVSREERVLAGLLARPASVLSTVPVTAQTWTSDLRAEIFLAWRSAAGVAGGRVPRPSAVADALERRMLRAPDEMSGFAGPASGRTKVYLGRLLATRVGAGPALAAARDLYAEDQQAAARLRQADEALAELASRAAARRPLVQLPPRPTPDPSGPTARI